MKANRYQLYHNGSFLNGGHCQRKWEVATEGKVAIVTDPPVSLDLPIIRVQTIRRSISFYLFSSRYPPIVDGEVMLSSVSSCTFSLFIKQNTMKESTTRSVGRY